MRTLIAGVLLVSALSLAAAADPQRIPTTFTGSAYNSAANEYLPAATFMEIHPRKNGNDVIMIEVDDPYWSSTYKKYVPKRLVLEKERVPEYLAVIDKYASWAEIATRDGDMITKEIARVKARGGKLRFQMHSGNTTNHYLVVELCLLVCMGEEVLTFDYPNVMSLRETLVNFEAGELAVNPDLDSKYQ